MQWLAWHATHPPAQEFGLNTTVGPVNVGVLAAAAGGEDGGVAALLGGGVGGGGGAIGRAVEAEVKVCMCVCVMALARVRGQDGMWEHVHCLCVEARFARGLNDVYSC
jgi:hypothetical protein